MFISDLIDVFNSSQLLFLASVGFLSLLVGSFLNVVIIRLPIILARRWRQECYEFLQLSDSEQAKDHLGIFFPRSHCPNCKNQIRSVDNIPILSFILLRGRCHFCLQKISIIYPFVEALTAILCVFVAWHFGVTLQTIAGCFLTFLLIAQSGIDLKNKIIPDEITIPALWLGLIASMANVFCDTQSSIFGSVSGYLCLWLIYWIFYLATKKEGLGQGDFKLLAMLGAWLGWQSIPFIIVFSSVSGAIIGSIFLLMTKSERNTQIPFGPFIATAGWIFMLWGQDINNWYLEQTGIF